MEQPKIEPERLASEEERLQEIKDKLKKFKEPYWIVSQFVDGRRAHQERPRFNDHCIEYLQEKLEEPWTEQYQTRVKELLIREYEAGETATIDHTDCLSRAARLRREIGTERDCNIANRNEIIARSSACQEAVRYDSIVEDFKGNLGYIAKLLEKGGRKKDAKRFIEVICDVDELQTILGGLEKLIRQKHEELGKALTEKKISRWEYEGQINTQDYRQEE